MLEFNFCKNYNSGRRQKKTLTNKQTNITSTPTHTHMQTKTLKTHTLTHTYIHTQRPQTDTKRTSVLNSVFKSYVADGGAKISPL